MWHASSLFQEDWRHVAEIITLRKLGYIIDVIFPYAVKLTALIS